MKIRKTARIKKAAAPRKPTAVVAAATARYSDMGSKLRMTGAQELECGAGL
jgi:hypothetical protein